MIIYIFIPFFIFYHCRYQKEQETIRNKNPTTINMFGHLSLLAALFFIGTLKGELNQRKLYPFVS